jgi:hypothetical protein
MVPVYLSDIKGRGMSKAVEMTVTLFDVPEDTKPEHAAKTILKCLDENKINAKIEVPARGILNPHKDANILSECYDLTEHAKALETINAEMREEINRMRGIVPELVKIAVANWIAERKRRGPTF